MERINLTPSEFYNSPEYENLKMVDESKKDRVIFNFYDDNTGRRYQKFSTLPFFEQLLLIEKYGDMSDKDSLRFPLQPKIYMVGR